MTGGNAGLKGHDLSRNEIAIGDALGPPSNGKAPHRFLVLSQQKASLHDLGDDGVYNELLPENSNRSPEGTPLASGTVAVGSAKPSTSGSAANASSMFLTAEPSSGFLTSTARGPLLARSRPASTIRTEAYGAEGQQDEGMVGSSQGFFTDMWGIPSKNSPFHSGNTGIIIPISTTSLSGTPQQQITATGSGRTSGASAHAQGQQQVNNAGHGLPLPRPSSAGARVPSHQVLATAFGSVSPVTGVSGDRGSRGTPTLRRSMQGGPSTPAPAPGGPPWHVARVSYPGRLPTISSTTADATSPTRQISGIAAPFSPDAGITPCLPSSAAPLAAAPVQLPARPGSSKSHASRSQIGNEEGRPMPGGPGVQPVPLGTPVTAGASTAGAGYSHELGKPASGPGDLLATGEGSVWAAGSMLAHQGDSLVGGGSVIGVAPSAYSITKASQQGRPTPDLQQQRQQQGARQHDAGLLRKLLSILTCGCAGPSCDSDQPGAEFTDLTASPLSASATGKHQHQAALKRQGLSRSSKSLPFNAASRSNSNLVPGGPFRTISNVPLSSETVPCRASSGNCTADTNSMYNTTGGRSLDSHGTGQYLREDDSAAGLVLPPSGATRGSPGASVLPISLAKKSPVPRVARKSSKIAPMAPTAVVQMVNNPAAEQDPLPLAQRIPSDINMGSSQQLHTPASLSVDATQQWSATQPGALIPLPALPAKEGPYQHPQDQEVAQLSHHQQQQQQQQQHHLQHQQAPPAAFHQEASDPVPPPLDHIPRPTGATLLEMLATDSELAPALPVAPALPEMRRPRSPATTQEVVAPPTPPLFKAWQQQKANDPGLRSGRGEEPPTPKLTQQAGGGRQVGSVRAPTPLMLHDLEDQQEDVPLDIYSTGARGSSNSGSPLITTFGSSTALLTVHPQPAPPPPRMGLGQSSGTTTIRGPMQYHASGTSPRRRIAGLAHDVPLLSAVHPQHRAGMYALDMATPDVTGGLPPSGTTGIDTAWAGTRSGWQEPTAMLRTVPSVPEQNHAAGSLSADARAAVNEPGSDAVSMQDSPSHQEAGRHVTEENEGAFVLRAGARAMATAAAAAAASSVSTAQHADGSGHAADASSMFHVITSTSCDALQAHSSFTSATSARHSHHRSEKSDHPDVASSHLYSTTSWATATGTYLEIPQQRTTSEAKHGLWPPPVISHASHTATMPDDPGPQQTQQHPQQQQEQHASGAQLVSVSRSLTPSFTHPRPPPSNNTSASPKRPALRSPRASFGSIDRS